MMGKWLKAAVMPRRHVFSQLKGGSLIRRRPEPVRQIEHRRCSASHQCAMGLFAALQTDSWIVAQRE